MPAVAKLPSGSRVDVPCGQPAQNAGMRAQQAGRTLRHTRHRRVLDVQTSGSQEAGETGGDDLRRQLHQRRQQRRAGCVGLAADLRTFVRRQVVERVADLRSRRSCAFPPPPGSHACRGRIRAGPRFPAARSSRSCRARSVRGPSRSSMRSACNVSACARPTVTMPIGASSGAEDAPVEPVGACPGERRGNALLHHAALQFGAVGREAQMRIVVQPVRRQREVRRDELRWWTG